MKFDQEELAFLLDRTNYSTYEDYLNALPKLMFYADHLLNNYKDYIKINRFKFFSNIEALGLIFELGNDLIKRIRRFKNKKTLDLESHTEFGDIIDDLTSLRFSLMNTSISDGLFSTPQKEIKRPNNQHFTNELLIRKLIRRIQCSIQEDGALFNKLAEYYPEIDSIEDPIMYNNIVTKIRKNFVCKLIGNQSQNNSSLITNSSNSMDCVISKTYPSVLRNEALTIIREIVDFGIEESVSDIYRYSPISLSRSLFHISWVSKKFLQDQAIEQIPAFSSHLYPEIKLRESKISEIQFLTPIKVETPYPENTEIKVPYTQIPEIKIHDAKIFELKIPHIKTTQSKISYTNVPQIKIEYTEIPEIKIFNAKIPELTLFDTKGAEIKIENAEIPEIKIFNAKIPEIAFPYTKNAEFKILNVKIPELKIINAKVPEFKIFDSKISRIQFFDAKIPEIKVPYKESTAVKSFDCNKLEIEFYDSTKAKAEDKQNGNEFGLTLSLIEKGNIIDKYFIKAYDGYPMRSSRKGSNDTSAVTGAVNQTSASSSGTLPNLREPFAYKVLESFELAPPTCFIINPFISYGFYIVTQDLTKGDEYFTELRNIDESMILKFTPPEEGKDDQHYVALTKLDIIKRIMCLADLNAGNVGFVLEGSSKIDNQTILSKLRPYVVDFRVLGKSADDENNICTLFLEGIGYTDQLMQKVLESSKDNDIRKKLFFGTKAIQNIQERLKQLVPLEGQDKSENADEIRLKSLLNDKADEIKSLFLQRRNDLPVLRNRTNAELIGFKFKSSSKQQSGGSDPEQPSKDATQEQPSKDATQQHQGFEYIEDAVNDLYDYCEEILHIYKILKNFILNGGK